MPQSTLNFTNFQYLIKNSRRSVLIGVSGQSFMSALISRSNLILQEIGSDGWYVGFILWTIILCLLVRFIGVYIFTFIANK